MKRRDLFSLPALLGMGSYVRDLAAEAETGPTGSITDVEGLKVGHSTRTDRPTGCTVLLAEEGATGGVDQRGGAPGTRETDLLNPVNHVQKLNAIVLSGGSAYGLATADGVMRYLEEKGFGYPVGRGSNGTPRVVPIVPAAILMDLGYGGDWKIRPTADNGYQACAAAVNKPPQQGSVGAGAGATVGKMGGPGRSMKGGFGTASLRLPNGIVIGAMVATNGVGDIWDHIHGKLVAGTRTEDGKHLADIMKLMREGKLPAQQPPRPENTTIGVIATNVDLTKTQITKVTQMSADGYALAIRPVHTPGDGDTIFGAATGKLKIASADLDRLLGMIGALAADVMGQAIVSSVLHAKGNAPGALRLRFGRHAEMNGGGYLAVLLAYAGGLVALGLYLSRRVRSTKDFFVAGRQLPPGLIFATFLAANIGAGSTVGATGRGYTQGLSAVWWVGSAGLGSLVLAFFVGPRIYRLARAHNLLTVGDFLEMRYSRGVRLFLGATLWLGCLFILAGQLIAIAWILNVTAGLPKPWGCALGGLVVAIYFSAGGLRTAAWLHVIQITVKMTGFFIAVPWALHAVGGWDHLHTVAAPPGYFSPVGVGLRGVLGYIVIFMPNFFIAPGLIQKLYGARDESAVRQGVGWHAAVLLLYAVLPALLGMIARAAFPGLANPELALPILLRDLLPWWLGALLLGAVFSAELSAGDAVLFMLSTSLGKDLYKSVLNPAAGEEQLLRVTRLTSALAGVLGTALAMVLPTVVDALTAFYGLLTVVLMVPLLAGLYLKSPTSFAALLTMTTSVIAMVAAHFLTEGKGIGIFNPVALGIGTGAAVMALMVLAKGISYDRHVSS